MVKEKLAWIKDKDWYKSKTIWSGIVIFVYGVLMALGVNIPTEAHQLIITTCTAGGLVGIREAIGKK